MANAPFTADKLAQTFLLNGSDGFGVSNERLTVLYPGDQATIVGECYQLGMHQTELAEQAAREGFARYRHSTPAERSAILNRLAERLERHTEDLTVLIAREAGKPVQLAKAEVDRAIGLCRAYALEAARSEGITVGLPDGRRGEVRLFPAGPVLAITPFNFPLNLIMHKLAPAMAAGCSITIKPAPQTPLTALFLGRLAAEAGYRAISVVPAGNEVAEALVRSDAFALLSFTGSARVGWHLKSIAGKKAVILELGGNAAVIVEDFSRPVDEMARRIAWGAFAYAGQVCISVQRILVREELMDPFRKALVEAARTIRVGDPMDPEVLVGPLVSTDALQSTRQRLRDALAAGANVVYGGNSFNAFTLNPTILDRTTPEMAVEQEECFAPLVTLSSYRSLDEAFDRVNASRFGLQAGLYTLDHRKVEQAYQTLDVGGLIVNDVPTYRADWLPYGGVKDSGLGREGVLGGIRAYSHEKILVQ